MRAVVCKAYGPPENLVVEDIPEPTPKPGEVLVGQPVSLPVLARWRLGLLLAGWLAWSAGLVALCAWWWRP